jgi:hypothetical protein
MQGGIPLAYRRPPSPLTPEAEGSLPLSFGRLVRPVFEKTCIPCHQREKLQANGKIKPLLDVKVLLNTDSVRQAREWVFVYDAATSRTEPGNFGALGSRMGRVLLKTHADRVTAEELRRVTLWLDLGAPLLGSYHLDPELIRKQLETTEIVWPDGMDPNNPTGVERDVPSPR